MNRRGFLGLFGAAAVSSKNLAEQVTSNLTPLTRSFSGSSLLGFGKGLETGESAVESTAEKRSLHPLEYRKNEFDRISKKIKNLFNKSLYKQERDAISISEVVSEAEISTLKSVSLATKIRMNAKKKNQYYDRNESLRYGQQLKNILAGRSYYDDGDDD